LGEGEHILEVVQQVVHKVSFGSLSYFVHEQLASALDRFDSSKALKQNHIFLVAMISWEVEIGNFLAG